MSDTVDKNQFSKFSAPDPMLTSHTATDASASLMEENTNPDPVINNLKDANAPRASTPQHKFKEGGIPDTAANLLAAQESEQPSVLSKSPRATPLTISSPMRSGTHTPLIETPPATDDLEENPLAAAFEKSGKPDDHPTVPDDILSPPMESSFPRFNGRESPERHDTVKDDDSDAPFRFGGAIAGDNQDGFSSIPATKESESFPEAREVAAPRPEAEGGIEHSGSTPIQPKEDNLIEIGGGNVETRGVSDKPREEDHPVFPRADDGLSRALGAGHPLAGVEGDDLQEGMATSEAPISGDLIDSAQTAQETAPQTFLSNDPAGKSREEEVVKPMTVGGELHRAMEKPAHEEPTTQQNQPFNIQDTEKDELPSASEQSIGDTATHDAGRRRPSLTIEDMDRDEIRRASEEPIGEAGDTQPLQREPSVALVETDINNDADEPLQQQHQQHSEHHPSLASADTDKDELHRASEEPIGEQEHKEYIDESGIPHDSHESHGSHESSNGVDNASIIPILVKEPKESDALAKQAKEAESDTPLVPSDSKTELHEPESTPLETDAAVSQTAEKEETSEQSPNEPDLSKIKEVAAATALGAPAAAVLLHQQKSEDDVRKGESALSTESAESLEATSIEPSTGAFGETLFPAEQIAERKTSSNEDFHHIRSQHNHEVSEGTDTPRGEQLSQAERGESHEASQLETFQQSETVKGAEPEATEKGESHEVHEPHAAGITHHQDTNEPEKSEEPETILDEPETRLDEPETRLDEPESRLEEPVTSLEEPEVEKDNSGHDTLLAGNLEQPETRPIEREAKSDDSETKLEEPEAKHLEPETTIQDPESKEEKSDHDALFAGAGIAGAAALGGGAIATMHDKERADKDDVEHEEPKETHHAPELESSNSPTGLFGSEESSKPVKEEVDGMDHPISVTETEISSPNAPEAISHKPGEESNVSRMYTDDSHVITPGPIAHDGPVEAPMIPPIDGPLDGPIGTDETVDTDIATVGEPFTSPDQKAADTMFDEESQRPQELINHPPHANRAQEVSVEEFGRGTDFEPPSVAATDSSRHAEAPPAGLVADTPIVKPIETLDRGDADIPGEIPEARAAEIHEERQIQDKTPVIERLRDNDDPESAKHVEDEPVEEVVASSPTLSRADEKDEHALPTEHALDEREEKVSEAEPETRLAGMEEDETLDQRQLDSVLTEPTKLPESTPYEHSTLNTEEETPKENLNASNDPHFYQAETTETPTATDETAPSKDPNYLETKAADREEKEDHGKFAAAGLGAAAAAGGIGYAAHEFTKDDSADKSVEQTNLPEADQPDEQEVTKLHEDHTEVPTQEPVHEHHEETVLGDPERHDEVKEREPELTEPEIGEIIEPTHASQTTQHHDEPLIAASEPHNEVEEREPESKETVESTPFAAETIHPTAEQTHEPITESVRDEQAAPEITAQEGDHEPQQDHHKYDEEREILPEAEPIAHTEHEQTSFEESEPEKTTLKEEEQKKDNDALLAGTGVAGAAAIGAGAFAAHHHNKEDTAPVDEDKQHVQFGGAKEHKESIRSDEHSKHHSKEPKHDDEESEGKAKKLLHKLKDKTSHMLHRHHDKEETRDVKEEAAHSSDSHHAEPIAPHSAKEEKEETKHEKEEAVPHSESHHAMPIAAATEAVPRDHSETVEELDQPELHKASEEPVGEADIKETTHTDAHAEPADAEPSHIEAVQADPPAEATLPEHEEVGRSAQTETTLSSQPGQVDRSNVFEIPPAESGEGLVFDEDLAREIDAQNNSQITEESSVAKDSDAPVETPVETSTPLQQTEEAVEPTVEPTATEQHYNLKEAEVPVSEDIPRSVQDDSAGDMLKGLEVKDVGQDNSATVGGTETTGLQADEQPKDAGLAEQSTATEEPSDASAAAAAAIISGTLAGAGTVAAASSSAEPTDDSGLRQRKATDEPLPSATLEPPQESTDLTRPKSPSTMSLSQQQKQKNMLTAFFGVFFLGFFGNIGRFFSGIFGKKNK